MERVSITTDERGRNLGFEPEDMNRDMNMVGWYSGGCNQSSSSTGVHSVEPY